MKRRDLFKGLAGTLIALAVKPLAGLSPKVGKWRATTTYAGTNTGVCQHGHARAHQTCVQCAIVDTAYLPPGTEVQFFSPDFQHSRGVYTVAYSRGGRLAFTEMLEGVVPGDVAIYTRDGYVNAQSGKIVQWSQRGISEQDLAKLYPEANAQMEQDMRDAWDNTELKVSKLYD